MKDNQCNRLLKYLEEHDHIGPITALTDLGIYRLSARIHQLRQAGVPISTTLRPHTVYRLEAEYWRP